MSEQGIKLYTYVCVDGVWRTRCFNHIQTTGPYRIRGDKAYARGYQSRGKKCYECEIERLTKEGVLK